MTRVGESLHGSGLLLRQRFEKLRWKWWNWDWKWFLSWSERLTQWGMQHGQVALYDENLIQKLRKVYFRGVPASVALLSHMIADEHCYDMANILATALIGMNYDIQVMYGSIRSLRKHPVSRMHRRDSGYVDHCVVVQKTPDRKRWVFDTSRGMCYRLWLYWLIERPKVRKVNGACMMRAFARQYGTGQASRPRREMRDVAMATIPYVEEHYGEAAEIYARSGIHKLQREVELYKRAVGYPKKPVARA